MFREIIIIISLLTANGIYSCLFMAPETMVVLNNRNKKDQGINEKIGRYYGHNIMNRKSGNNDIVRTEDKRRDYRTMAGSYKNKKDEDGF